MPEPLMYRFYKPSRVTELEASSLSEARRKYKARTGSFPTDDVEITIVKDEN